MRIQFSSSSIPPPSLKSILLCIKYYIIFIALVHVELLNLHLILKLLSLKIENSALSGCLSRQYTTNIFTKKQLNKQIKNKSQTTESTLTNTSTEDTFSIYPLLESGERVCHVEVHYTVLFPGCVSSVSISQTSSAQMFLLVIVIGH